MGVEIERKFLVDPELVGGLRDGTEFLQGYFDTADESTVRVRLAGEKAMLTIKGPGDGLSRPEFEYPVPVQDARDMLRLFCRGRTVEKTRYQLPMGSHVWEVDVFSGANAPLVLAEIELSHPDEAFTIPPWLGKEVTGERRFHNSVLAVESFGG